METKVCVKCNEEKELILFDITYKTLKKEIKTFKKSCKSCEYLRITKYKSENKEVILERQKIWRSNNKSITKKYRKDGYDKNKEAELEYHKKYISENRESISEKQKVWRYENKDTLNKKRINRYNNDILYKLSITMRNSIRSSFIKNGYCKNKKTHEILGIAHSDLKLYLESKFETWMTWDNYGQYNGYINFGWDIDHIIPVSSGKTEEEIIKLNHYTNLQPLCSYINRVIKKDNINYNN